jgi:hypothetical protein
MILNSAECNQLYAEFRTLRANCAIYPSFYIPPEQR